MKKLNLKGVEKTTWIRTAVLIIALINQGLVIFGAADKSIDTQSAEYYISFLLTLISSVWSWWKNNSFTDLAQKADTNMYTDSNSVG